ncbi:RcnB family protein [Pseudomonas sp. HR96]|uniref:RcnB family protein n=1 Tax=Pseudomonas sp. HR96 TaxID=1027966 RepID=UPI002A75634B|nr:RcnB family protein [Pseudomonas sp. HR96]WPO98372.1 RcnB family protein [Pseudomonas sp. HR96]
MSARTLFGATLLGALLLTGQAQAASATIDGVYNPRVGTQAPARYNGTGLTQKQMDEAGLKAPAAGAKWVQIGDKYVQLHSSDGTVLAVEPTVK